MKRRMIMTFWQALVAGRKPALPRGAEARGGRWGGGGHGGGDGRWRPTWAALVEVTWVALAEATSVALLVVAFGGLGAGRIGGLGAAHVDGFPPQVPRPHVRPRALLTTSTLEGIRFIGGGIYDDGPRLPVLHVNHMALQPASTER